LGEGLGLLHPATRDRVLQTVGATRMVVPDLDLRFVPGRAVYDANSDEVRFSATASRGGVSCAVGRQTLELLAATSLDRDGCLAALRQYRDRIERALRDRYMTQPVDGLEEIRLTVADVDRDVSTVTG
jgi:Protein of unknown function (DUF1488)/Biotin and Thiamin Synthesis associated domain